LKTGKKSPLSDKMKKKRISFKVDDNFDNKKPMLYGEFKVTVLDTVRTKIKIIPLIEELKKDGSINQKSKSKIEISIEKSQVGLGLNADK
jgi:hypothetical protein